MKVSPVKQMALQHALPHQDVPSSGMVDYTPPQDLVHGNPKAILLTCSFGHLIPDALLDAFPNPWQRINIHPSLLPQLRGAAPIQWALARRLESSGVSIQTLEKGKFDTGRIVSQQEFAFPPPIPEGGETGFLQVEQVMATRAAELLVRTLRDLPERWANSWDQDEAQKTYAPKLKAQNSLIKWQNWSAADIVAREKAFAYLYPLSTTLQPPTSTSAFRPISVTFSNTSTLDHATLRSHDPAIASAFLSPATPAGAAGFSLPLNALVVKTQDDVLAVHTVKVATKKAKTAQEWYRAYRDRAHPASGLLSFQ
ncbi:related to methionyl-trna formyltransferase [Sporisorium reilianum f. sp. reilianum]|uniref:Related to methionyl-trna formyltransferase n=1 Tax=Sporisorium reilianum f. sp. reilianum TaxID=72559 RepID=A0A2N8UL03_9BASI|nr:related to methionyl-trna formyltransferase [Sporisorium reilianum f. sp. reilianum]